MVPLILNIPHAFSLQLRPEVEKQQAFRLFTLSKIILYILQIYITDYINRHHLFRKVKLSIEFYALYFQLNYFFLMQTCAIFNNWRKQTTFLENCKPGGITSSNGIKLMLYLCLRSMEHGIMKSDI